MLTEQDRNKVGAILQEKRLFVFDMDGTIYLGNRPFDFAVHYIKKLRECGYRVLFFTNNASHNPQFYAGKLKKLGFEPGSDEICTAGDVTAAFLTRKRPQKKVYLLGTSELYDQFKNAGIDLVADVNGIPDGRQADIVVTSFDTDLTYDKLKIACDYIRGGAEYLCTHPDFNCPTESGFVPDSGAIAAAVTASTGVRPLFFGKPYRTAVEMISEITGESFDKMVIFGDRLYTDIAVGRRHGITSVLVLTGETTEKDVSDAADADKPDVVLPSLAEAELCMETLKNH